MVEEAPAYTVEEIERRFDIDFLSGENVIAFYARHWIVFVRRVWWLVVVMGLILLLGRIWLARLEESPTLGPGILLVGLFLVSGFVLLFSYIDWHDDALILTNQRVIHTERTIFFFRGQQETSLPNVQNVESSVEGLLARLLGYGNIEIETAARGSDIAFGPIQNPREVQGQVMSRVRTIRSETSSRLMRDTLLHRLYPEQYPSPDLPGAGVSDEDGESITGLRQGGQFLLPPNPRVDGVRVTWYKHHFFLFQRLAWSVVMIVLLIVVAFFLPRVQSPASSLWLGWVLVMLVVLGLLVVNYQIWLGDIYEVTDRTIVDATRTPFGLFGETRRTAELGRIQNITFERPGLLANLLNYGDVLIQTAGEEDFTFDRLPRPAEVQREIYRRRELYRLRQEQREREEIAEWLVTYRDLHQEIPGEEGGIGPEPGPDTEL